MSNTNITTNGLTKNADSKLKAPESVNGGSQTSPENEGVVIKVNLAELLKALDALLPEPNLPEAEQQNPES